MDMDPRQPNRAHDRHGGQNQTDPLPGALLLRHSSIGSAFGRDGAGSPPEPADGRGALRRPSKMCASRPEKPTIRTENRDQGKTEWPT